MSEREEIIELSEEVINKILEEIFNEPAITIPYESPEDRWREFLK